MVGMINKILKAAIIAVAGMASIVGPAFSQQALTSTGERYIPTIWVDPDGCEHWVMDDGAEGYMSPHLTRDGLPVCKRGNTCGVLSSDQFFATDKYAISTAGRARLMEFFRSANARAFSISGHTDSRTSDAYNMRLSQNRADAVARIAREAGVTVTESLGYGECKPRATNNTSAGMAQKRRVEIVCVQ